MVAAIALDGGGGHEGGVAVAVGVVEVVRGRRRGRVCCGGREAGWARPLFGSCQIDAILSKGGR